MAIMFPFSQRELERREREPEKFQPQQWTRRGFFKDKPIPRSEVALKASNARLWLETLLYDGPKPAREIIQAAKQDGICEPSLRRAKRYHRIKSVKRGGRQGGYGAVWLWIFSTPVSN